jgi:hypothetical protein
VIINIFLVSECISLIDLILYLNLYLPKDVQQSWFGVPQSLNIAVSEADNGQIGGERVQLHSINNSHGPSMLLVNPWYATSRRR